MGNVRQFHSENDPQLLPDNTCLWRYVPLKTLFFYLSGNIFIPSIEKLRRDDPFEGEFFFNNPWFNTVMAEHYGSDLTKVDEWLLGRCDGWERNSIELNKGSGLAANFLEKHYFEFIRNTRCVWCWFLSNSESASMWSVYGNQGVALQTTVGKLRRILEKTDKDFIFRQMFYVSVMGGETFDVIPELPEHSKLLLHPYFLKRKEYQSENEVRFVTCGRENRNLGGILLEGIDPKDWIQQILFWPKLTSLEENCLKSAVGKYVPNIPCSKSDLMSNNSGQFSEDSVFASYISGLEDASWKNNDDGIPEILKKI
jgi:hypothetical protein